jgi:glycosyltransferase involved in cell wall biosynthesis
MREQVRPIKSALRFIPITSTSLLTPDYLPSCAWLPHGPFAFWLVENLRPRMVAELGVHEGFSYFCFCQAVQQLGLETSCFGIDTWVGGERADRSGDGVFPFLMERNRQYAPFSKLLRSEFDDAITAFADGNIDILHIDGRRKHEDVKHDYEGWLPKVAANGVVLIHGTRDPERGYGGWRLYTDLMEAHPTFEFMHGNGLGIVAPKGTPSALAAIFDPSDGALDIFRQDIRMLGEKVQRAAADSELIAKLREASTVIANERDQIAAERDTLSKDIHTLGNELVAEQEAARRKFSKSEVFALLSKRLAKSVSPGTPRRFFAAPRGEASVLRASTFFDQDWYLATYQDVANARLDPVSHYIEHGASEGRDPGPFFSTSSYLLNNPDVYESNVNPLAHFELFGMKEGRSCFSRPNLKLSVADGEAIDKHIATFERRPLISVVMPVYNTHPKFLLEAINSVLDQRYSNWELCIANDASPDPSVAKLLNEYSAGDERIKVIHREVNGNISAASNSALDLVSGEFIALIDHDDLMHETALYEVAALLNERPELDIIYSDEDQIDENGERSGGYYKSDFNPELLLGQNMISHLGVYRSSLIREIGGFRIGFEGSQDYDLALRAWMATSARKIAHIPEILYHWRRNTRAPSFSESQLERCTTAARRAIQEFLDREGEGAKVVAAPVINNFSRVLRKVPDPAPLVSVIIPTKDRADLLARSASGVLDATSYPNLELLIVDHESTDRKARDLLAKLQFDPRVKVVPYSGAFNFSAINNLAVQRAKGSIVALVNNDIEVLKPDWLSEMVSLAVRAEIGAVGAKLLYPDGRIQHAGVVVGLGAFAGHSFHFVPAKDPCYLGHAMLARAVSAVTAACLVVRKNVYLEVGGLNEIDLPVAFNDVDFCLKIQAAGYRNVWTPFAELIHHESVTRGKETTPEQKARFARDTEYMMTHWRDVYESDPFYNVNLVRDRSTYDVAAASRRVKPWRALNA